MALQLAGAKVTVAPFASDMKPDWAALEDLIASKKPRMVSSFTPLPPPPSVTLSVILHCRWWSPVRTIRPVIIDWGPRAGS